MKPGTRRNQKKDPKILITNYTDTKDYSRQYAKEAARLLKENRPPKRVPTDEETEQKLEKQRRRAREHFKKLRANVETRKTLNHREWEYKKSRPELILRRNISRQLCRNEKRVAVLSHYGVDGEPVCRRCGFSDVRALAVDHINNDGAAHRKKIGNQVYLWLLRNGFPEGFQTLCFNCNTIKEYERLTLVLANKMEHNLVLMEVGSLSGVLL